MSWLRSLALAAFLLVPGLAHAAFGDFVQTDSGINSSAVLPGAVVVGNTIVVGFSHLTVNPTTSVTDNLGNTYALAIAQDDGTHVVEIWSAVVTAGGACTVTVAATPDGIVASEYAGAAAVDVTAGDFAATGATASSGPATPTQNGALLVGMFMSDTDLTKGPDPWTTDVIVNTGSAFEFGMEHQVQTTAAAIAATMTHLSAFWVAVMAAFVPAAGGATTPQRSLVGVGQ